MYSSSRVYLVIECIYRHCVPNGCVNIWIQLLVNLCTYTIKNDSEQRCSKNYYFNNNIQILTNFRVFFQLFWKVLNILNLYLQKIPTRSDLVSETSIEVGDWTILTVEKVCSDTIIKR